jgi:hypothetical protein
MIASLHLFYPEARGHAMVIGMGAAHPAPKRPARASPRSMPPTGDAPSLLDGAVASGYDVPIGRTEKAGTFLAPKLVNAAVE